MRRRTWVKVRRIGLTVWFVLFLLAISAWATALPDVWFIPLMLLCWIVGCALFALDVRRLDRGQ